MNNATHISNEDLTLFALQVLPEAEMSPIFSHLKDCALCRAELGAIQGDLVAYAMTAPMQAPPTQARERLLHQVSKEKKMVVAEREEAHLEPILYPRNSRMYQMEAPVEKKRSSSLSMWAGWAVAASVTVVAGMQYQQRQFAEANLAVVKNKLTESTVASAKAEQVMQTLTDAGAMQVALHIPGAQPSVNPEGHLAYVKSQGSLVFVGNHLDPLQQYKTYELWVLPADKTAKPIPAGLFKPDQFGTASVVLPELPKGVAANGFGVTIEEDGGAQSPTMANLVLLGT